MHEDDTTTTTTTTTTTPRLSERRSIFNMRSMLSRTAGSVDAGSTALVKKTLPSGDVYEGGWRYERPNGSGVCHYVSGAIFEGYFKNGTRHGEGRFTTPEGAVYIGDWLQDGMNGVGTLTLPDGTTYEGSFFDNERQGLGRIVYPNGDVYEGMWRAGRPNGPGRYRWANGAEYDGEWCDGKFHGNGTHMWATGERYDGDWLEGRQHGYGTLTYKNGDSFVGTWREGKKQGVGVYQFQDADNDEVGLPYAGGGTTTSGGLGNPAAAARGVDEVASVHDVVLLEAAAATTTTPTGSPVKTPAAAEDRSHVGDHPLPPLRLGPSDRYAGRPLIQPVSSYPLSLSDTPTSTAPSPPTSPTLATAPSVLFRSAESNRVDNFLVWEFDQDVLVKEELIPSRALRKVKGVKTSERKRAIRAAEVIDRPGETIYKGHRSYDLVVALQQGVRYSIGRLGPRLTSEVIATATAAAAAARLSIDGGSGVDASSPTKRNENRAGLDKAGSIVPTKPNENSGERAALDTSQSLTSSSSPVVLATTTKSNESSGERVAAAGLDKAGPLTTLSSPPRNPSLATSTVPGTPPDRSTSRFPSTLSTSTLPPPDAAMFTEKLIQFFPHSGSRLTPPHPAKDFEWKDYMPIAFAKIREMFHINHADYMLSISTDRSLRELTSPGKSGSVFYITHDDKFVLKTVQKNECKILQRLLPAYVEHCVRHPDTLLTRFFGLYRIRMGVKRKSVRFVVMGNIFRTDLMLHETYDLKGSTLGRFTKRPRAKSVTLKDLDLHYSFKLEKHWREKLLYQVSVDAAFLETNRIMDYSMLVGVHFRGRSGEDGFGSGGGNQELEGGGVLPPSAAPSPINLAPAAARLGRSATLPASDETSADDGVGLVRRRSTDQQRHVRFDNTNTNINQAVTSASPAVALVSETSLDPFQLPPNIQVAEPSIHMPKSLLQKMLEQGWYREKTRRKNRIAYPGKSAPRATLTAGGIGGAIISDELSSSRPQSPQPPPTLFKSMSRTMTLRPAGHTSTDYLNLQLGYTRVRLGNNMAATAVHATPISPLGGTATNAAGKDEQEDENGPVEDVVLYLGMIDVLQHYRLFKRFEHGIKALRYDPPSVSVTDPTSYAKRFVAFMENVFL